MPLTPIQRDRYWSIVDALAPERRGRVASLLPMLREGWQISGVQQAGLAALPSSPAGSGSVAF